MNQLMFALVKCVNMSVCCLDTIFGQLEMRTVFNLTRCEDYYKHTELQRAEVSHLRATCCSRLHKHRTERGLCLIIYSFLFFWRGKAMKIINSIH